MSLKTERLLKPYEGNAKVGFHAMRRIRAFELHRHNPDCGVFFYKLKSV